MKLFEDQLFFYGYKDILSNMYPVNLKFENFVLPSSEHFYVLMKCLSANDLKTVDKILKEPNPHEVKKMGHGIQGLDVIHWDSINKDVMTAILVHKFQQPGFKELIIKSDGLQLIEASPNLIWGCGVHVNEVVGKLLHFPGENRCGNCMMAAREMIIGGVTINPDTIPDLL